MRRRFSVLGLTVALIGAVLAVAPAPSQAATSTVFTRDNRFDPEEIRIDPGDTVVWNNAGSRIHTVNADDRSFRSGDMGTRETYSHTFPEEGYFPYFCKYHGARGGVGMAGVVIVGDPEIPGDGGGGGLSDSDVLVVPKEFPTIQKAVDAAKPGKIIKIQPGLYNESVAVKTPRLTIKGVDRFRTIIHGNDERSNGFLVDGANNVRITNLTVRNFTGNGIFFNDVNGYQADHIDSIKNRTYGIYAFDSYNGVIRDSFGYGSGDSAFYIGQCLNCGGLIENVVSTRNFLGYSGTNASGVVIRNSVFRGNGAGIVPNTLPTEELSPNRGTLMINNRVFNNNYKTIPGAGFSNTVSIPFGTGIWMAGTWNNKAINNVIKNHNSFGILVSESISPDSIPMNNQSINNMIRNSDFDEDGYGYDLAWTGEGSDNCFTNNNIKGATGPPEAQTLFACANRPFVGTPYPPVSAFVAASLCCPDTREQKEPPEPNRPDCQRGRPGCRRR
jgi:plastocyanin